MYLRSLEMQGFKSFPDKTKLEFGKGISAVVGPNGSGKSNISDAMRWVMGEKSSKSLRGKKMEDVIFSGTLNRPKSGFAQVTLTIDNTDRALKTDSDIVSVSRKLYRNGDSEYLINGEQVRLKDIDEMFMDTGLGRDGYSIVSQGKISEIVTGKTDDLRQILEEAAGISKFRSKKEETERELARAEENMSRLNDILGELSDRLGPLEAQCEKAKRFRTLDEEKRGLEISLWSARLSELMTLQQQFEEKLSLLDGQYESLSTEIDELDKRIVDEFSKAAQKGDEAARMREQIHKIELDDSKAESDLALLDNDIKHLRTRISEAQQQIDDAKSSGYFLSAQVTQKQQQLEDVRKKAQEILSLTADAEKELSGAENALLEHESELEELSNCINELYLKRSNAAFTLEIAKNDRFSAQEELEASKEEQQELAEKLKLCISERESAEKRCAELAESAEQLKNRLDGFTKLWENRSAKHEAAKKEFSDNEMSLSGIEQRLGILKDLENAMEGFYYSVKFIMKTAKQGMLRGVCGSVAQLITVKAEYSTAIETALGSAMQNIVVENEDAAKRCIKLLKEKKAGRATFLPLEIIDGKLLDRPPQGEDGYVALASELVEHDSRYSAVIRHLLGRTAVAEDIDSASVIAKKYGYRFKIVTLDGQVINSGGTYTGGSASKSTGILSRKNEIAELEAEKVRLCGLNTELKAKCEKYLQETQKLAADLEGEREKLSKTENDLIRAQMEDKRVSELNEQLEAEDRKLKDTAEKLLAKIKDADERSSSAALSLSQLDTEIAHNEEKREKRRGENAGAAEHRAQLSQKLADLRISYAELQKDEQSCRAALEQLDRELADGVTGEKKLKDDIADFEDQIERKQQDMSDISSRSEGSADRIGELEKKIDSAQREQSDINMNAEKLRTEQKNKMNERETLAEELTRGRERSRTVENEFDELAGKLWDEYGLTRSQAQEQTKPPEDVKSAKARLTELRAQIKKLGSVNPGAVEEYDEVSQRFKFMNEQLEDVNRSKQELTQLIYSLTENMRSIFSENFDKISACFTSIFKELFGGGKASLSLTDPEDVLECDIEINVAPPGKVVKNMLALSGGETSFIAACIYFAILTVHPSPFCVLDEIEAAFDDVNVAKYAAYLHKLTDRTQFITITHRRGTMEEADILYGVTMQEDGISKLLKMDMGEARQLSLG